jgi:hypothetical protein
VLFVSTWFIVRWRRAIAGTLAQKLRSVTKRARKAIVLHLYHELGFNRRPISRALRRQMSGDDLAAVVKLNSDYFVAMLTVLLCWPPMVTTTGTFVPERTPEGTITLI